MSEAILYDAAQKRFYRIVRGLFGLKLELAREEELKDQPVFLVDPDTNALTPLHKAESGDGKFYVCLEFHSL